MMTAVKNGVTKADGKTPAGVYDVGAGRVQVDRAAKAGLVLGETGANFRAVDPTAGGDPSSLNIASMQNFSCAGTCSFTRTFRSTQKNSVTWETGARGALADKITIEPSTFTVESPLVAVLTLAATFALARFHHMHLAGGCACSGDCALQQRR